MTRRLALAVSLLVLALALAAWLGLVLWPAHVALSA